LVQNSVPGGLEVPHTSQIRSIVITSRFAARPPRSNHSPNGVLVHISSDQIKPSRTA